MDATTLPKRVYKITLARGQEFTATLTIPNSRPTANSVISLWAPSRLSVKDQPCRADDGFGHLVAAQSFGRSVSFEYQVATAGGYIVMACPAGGSTGVQYDLQVNAKGTPIRVPNPATAGCLSGRVDSITYSLQLIAAGLPDEVTIGGSRACESCQVKPPRYPEISNRLENALRSRVNVEACYDSGGNIK